MVSLVRVIFFLDFNMKYTKIQCITHKFCAATTKNCKRMQDSLISLSSCNTYVNFINILLLYAPFYLRFFMCFYHSIQCYATPKTDDLVVRNEIESKCFLTLNNLNSFCAFFLFHFPVRDCAIANEYRILYVSI